MCVCVCEEGGGGRYSQNFNYDPLLHYIGKILIVTVFVC